jgi:hypothetical protein
MPRPSIALAAMLVAAAPASAADLRALGSTLAERFMDGDVDPLWDELAPGFRQSLGSGTALAELAGQLETEMGGETEVRSERFDAVGVGSLYQRIGLHADGGEVLTQIGFDAQQRVSAFVVRPAPSLAETRFLDYRTRAELRLPFDGDWTVYWGGRDLLANYHAVDAAQRFAADFVVMRDGTSHRGDGSIPQDYNCWDQPVLAPADATVAAVVDGLPDQAIGATDTTNPAGNHIVLDVGEGEYLFLAHLQSGSVAVAAGDEVISGAELARCGNSGNSSEPHLHVHLQTTPHLADGEGLPAFFSTYLQDGEPIDSGEPQRGQVVSNAGGD